MFYSPLDSGASALLIKQTRYSNLKAIPAEQTQWTSSAVAFNINKQAMIQIILPELHERTNFTFNYHIAPTLE
jgi:hypothetical protein